MAEAPNAGILTPWALGVFAACVVPGYIGMLAYRLRQPGESISLREGFFEALFFGLVNFALTWPLVRYVVDSINFESNWDYFIVWAGGILESLAIPAALALLLDHLLDWLAKRQLILGRPKSGWDAFFLTKQPAKMLFHLKDGSLLGGQVGSDSFAGLYPASGSIYIEKTWRVSEEGQFKEVVPDSLGAILRPEDYDFVELFLPDPDNPAEP
jgi:hypothetical protein